jgi:hypothetical protein
VTTPVKAGCTWVNHDGELCNRPTKARGFCQAHYRAIWRRHGFTDIKRLKTTEKGAARNLEILQARREAAKTRLVRDAVEYARDWREASKQAVKSGNHRPAQDALLHAGVIEPVADPRQVGSSVIVRIGVALPHLPLPAGTVVDPVTGRYLPPAAETVEASEEPAED